VSFSSLTKGTTKNLEFLLSRHLHTEKNAQDRHGACSNANLTELGECELPQILSVCEDRGISEVLFADTQQCELTADLIATNLEVQKRPLGLGPYSLERWKGLSTFEFIKQHRELAEQLIRFRMRACNMRSNSWGELETASELSSRIKGWAKSDVWPPNSKSIVIGSSSVLTMLSNLALGILPTDDNYLNIQFSTGSPISASELKELLAMGIWPENEWHQISVLGGRVVATEYKASAGALNNSTAFIVPGAFGNSRLGPYGLYAKLAQSLAQQGVRTLTLDPLGCGESTQLPRTLESDRQSLLAAVRKLGRGKSVLIGHSTGANLIGGVDIGNVVTKISLAPITSYSLAKSQIGFVEDMKTGFCTHHGVSVERQIIDNPVSDGLPDPDFEEVAFFCQGDRYTDLGDYRNMKQHTKTVTYPDGDHNFSTTEISQNLISDVTQLVKMAIIKKG